MKTVEFVVKVISPKNPKFALLKPKIKLGEKVIWGQGGFLEAESEWMEGESINLTEGTYQITTRKTSTGSELPVIELLA